MAYYKDSKYNDTTLQKYIKKDFIKQIKEIWASVKKNIIQNRKPYYNINLPKEVQKYINLEIQDIDINFINTK